MFLKQLVVVVVVVAVASEKGAKMQAYLHSTYIYVHTYVHILVSKASGVYD